MKTIRDIRVFVKKTSILELKAFSKLGCGMWDVGLQNTSTETSSQHPPRTLKYFYWVFYAMVLLLNSKQIKQSAEKLWMLLVFNEFFWIIRPIIIPVLFFLF